MPYSQLRVIGVEDSTCDDRYGGGETTTPTNAMFELSAVETSWELPQPKMVTVRMSDLLSALRSCLEKRAAWIEDFSDDPIVITEDVYEVLLAYDRYRRAA